MVLAFEYECFQYFFIFFEDFKIKFLEFGVNRFDFLESLLNRDFLCGILKEFDGFKVGIFEEFLFGNSTADFIQRVYRYYKVGESSIIQVINIEFKLFFERLISIFHILQKSRKNLNFKVLLEICKTQTLFLERVNKLFIFINSFISHY